MSAQFQTLAKEIRYEIDSIKASRFLASAAPVANVEAALAFVARITLEFHKASHNCWAYRLGPDGAQYRSSDDGEPSGSAGRPIGLQIEGHGLTDTAVVVTRWFGGTKLGVGGLMRAYGGAAGQCLDQAQIRTILITRRLRLRFPYECSGAVQGLLAANQLTPESSDYGARVELLLSISEDALASFANDLRDRTASRAQLEELED
jgi:uncharacterized YigZ family protein